MPEKSFLDRTDEIIRAVFVQLKEMGGRAKGKEILAAIEKKLNLTPWELERNKTGNVRWETNTRFQTLDCVRAGYLTKADGYWNLTPEGEKALSLPPGQLIRVAGKKYREWRKLQGERVDPAPTLPEDTEKAVTLATYEEAEERAKTEIEAHIDRLLPYEFQELAAELMRAMGYHVPYVAPKGPDGGIDIIAYKDPLGTVAPRIKVQVKHRDQKVSAKDVRELEGLLRKDGDIGIFVSSGGFTAEAEREIRSSSRHIETIDLTRLISHWQEHYENVRQEGKALLPLKKLYFLAPEQE